MSDMMPTSLVAVAASRTVKFITNGLNVIEKEEFLQDGALHFA